jgi:exonuclease I
MYLFIDTETGGLTTDFSLLTVSAIVADKDFNFLCGGNADDTLYMEIRHDTYVVTPEALAINKLDLIHHSARGLKPDQARGRFMEFLTSAYQRCGQNKLVPAGHNVTYDLDFLWHHLVPKEDWRKFCTYPALDTAIIARFLNAVHILDGQYKLTEVCAAFGVHFENAHHAEADNKATLALARQYAAMMRALTEAPTS